MRPTQTLFGRLRRLPLTTKQTRKGFYKGNGVGMLGSFDPRNPRKFIPDYNKIRTFVYPPAGIIDFQLSPFVVKKVGKYIQGDREDEWSLPKEKLTGQEYLDMWKDAGGHDIVEYTTEPTNEGKK